MKKSYLYFSEVFENSLEIIGQFPFTKGPAAIKHVTEVLEPVAGELLKRKSVGLPPPDLQLDILAFVQSSSGRSRRSVGLNTIGMLLDRLSILTLKHWNLVHRRMDSEAATQLRATQVDEIIWSTAFALPGNSSVNNKLTRHDTTVEESDFGGCYTGLLVTNALLWEAQEILYNHDISVLPNSELRDYISFFSRGNIKRNAYIQAVEEAYWSMIG